MSTEGLCPSIYKTVSVAGDITQRKVCLSDGGSFRYGTYSDRWALGVVVAFGNDTSMYKLKGTPCGEVGACFYSAMSDTLVTKQYLVRYPIGALVIYKNFSKRIEKTLSPSTPTLEYRFNDSNPDYIFQSADQYQWPIGGISGSQNGQWLAVELRERAIGLLNLEDPELKMRRISPTRLSYGGGRDPIAELAVSNSGEQVAMMGVNAGLTVIDVVDDCGDDATDFRLQNNFPITNPCKLARINPEEFVDSFGAGLHPRFNADGAELRFYATSSWSSDQREVILRAAGYAPAQLDYLALGDSFTSGEGETDDRFYQAGTNDEFEKCHVSTRSYPYLIAAELGIATDKVKSVACSGAVTGDVIGDDLNYWGQRNRLAENGLRLDKTAKVINQTSAKELFVPGRVHQIRFAERYLPKVITIGIGGNDAGFMDKLRACVGTDTCQWANTPEGREKTALEVKALFNTLVDTYTALHDASPSSKIYAIGYPKVIDQDSQCDPLHGLLLNASEREFMNEGIAYINQVVAAAAAKAGIRYIDIQDSLGSQVLCGSLKPSVMNGIRLGDDSSLSEKTNWLKLIGNEGFHPQSSAHKLETTTIFASVSDLLTYSHCPGQEIACPNLSTNAPDPSSYWLPDGTTHDYASQRIAEFISDQADATNPREKTVNLTDYAFLPGSSVKAEIHSEPIGLGTFTSTTTGALNANIELPADLSEGFHTIYLYGTSYSGEDINLYQVIKYQLPDSDDREPTDVAVVQSESNDKITLSSIGAVQPAQQIVSNVSDTQSSTGTSSNGQARPSNTQSTPRFRDLSSVFTSIRDSEIETNTFAIPVLAFLFMGTGMAVYARLRRGR